MLVNMYSPIIQINKIWFKCFFNRHMQRMMVIQKCPICGDFLPPLSKVCPSCGQIIEDEGSDVSAIMSELEDVCSSYSKLTIRLYDYILLLIPIVYLIWAVVVIVKIARSNSLYSEYLVLNSKAQTSYGENPRFRSYLGNKDIEMNKQRNKNRTSHTIIYALLIIDAILLILNLMSILA